MLPQQKYSVMSLLSEWGLKLFEWLFGVCECIYLYEK